MLEKYRVLYVVSHPIQYQAPLLRLISQSNDINIAVLFYWNQKTQANFDVGFGREIKWDVPLLSGYQYQYLCDYAKRPNFISKLQVLWKAINPEKQDIIWTHGYSDFYTCAAILFSKIKGLKVFVRGESMLFSDEKNALFKKIKRRFAFRILDRLVTRYLAIGTNNKNFYIQNNITENKIVLCNYTVDNHFFREKYIESKNKISTLKAQLNLDVNRPVILYASKFLHRKHAMDLLDAYILLSENNQEPAPYLLFIGTGEAYDAVFAKATKKNWNSILFLGFKNQSELPAYFALTDIFVLPSTHENWGLVVNEAMSAECAIIVSDQVGCAIDLVQEGNNGTVSPARDITALAASLK